MKKKLAKALEFIAVVAALVCGVLVGRNIGVESILRGKEEPVTLAMTEGGLPEDYIGMPAADDIPRIEDAASWEDTWQTSYVTIEPEAIIGTGIGPRHPWVDPYIRRRRGGQKKRPEVTRTALDILDEYGEYFLLKLPDQSYILAQIPVDDAKKLKAGKDLTLPIGRKTAAHRQVLANISDLCREYNVNTEGVFYCINDKWNESHNFMVLLIRIGIVFLITIALGTILIVIVDKILKVDD